MGVYRSRIDTCGANGGLLVTHIPGHFPEIEQGLRTLSRGEIVGETGVAADPEETAFVHGIAHEPVCSAPGCLEVFGIPKDAVGHNESIECGAQVGQVGIQRLACLFIISHVEAAVGMLPGEQPVGSFAQQREQLLVRRIEQQDITQVDKHIVSQCDGFGMVAPFLDETLLFAEVILSAC